MRIGPNLYEYWIHRFKYSSVKKRAQFKSLLKQNKVTLYNHSEYKQSQYFVYRSTTSIKIVKG